MWIGLFHSLQYNLSNQCHQTTGNNNLRIYFNHWTIPAAAQKRRGDSYPFSQHNGSVLTHDIRPQSTIKSKAGWGAASLLLSSRYPEMGRIYHLVLRQSEPQSAHPQRACGYLPMDVIHSCSYTGWRKSVVLSRGRWVSLLWDGLSSDYWESMRYKVFGGIWPSVSFGYPPASEVT